MTTVTQPITPGQLLTLQDANSTELVNGELVEKPVSEESSYIGTQISTLLGMSVLQSREARVYGSDLGYQCFPDEPGRIRKPDVSVVRADRLAGIRPNPGFMPIPADLAVEVVSPNDLVYELSEKVEEYLAAGFGLVWVVNPAVRSVQVHRRDGPTVVLRERDELTGESALPAFRCKVADLFAGLT